MCARIAKDPTLINLFVPRLDCEDNISATSIILEDLNTSITNTHETTALTVTKQYALINPHVVYAFKKSIKLSIRSFLLSLSLTILNFFI